MAERLWVAPEPWGVVDDGWPAILFCAKTYHQRLLGYKQRLDADHPEYLWAYRCTPGMSRSRLYLNLVDAPVTRLIPDTVIWEGLRYLDIAVGQNDNHTLLLCDQGCSRSACIALMWMARRGLLPRELAVAEDFFRCLYPPYAPSPGIHGWMVSHWQQLTTA